MYNAEVIEVSSSVSLLVVFPSLENVCLVAGQSDKLLQRNDLIPLPVQVTFFFLPLPNHKSLCKTFFFNMFFLLSLGFKFHTYNKSHVHVFTNCSKTFIAIHVSMYVWACIYLHHPITSPAFLFLFGIGSICM